MQKERLLPQYGNLQTKKMHKCLYISLAIVNKILSKWEEKFKTFKEKKSVNLISAKFKNSCKLTSFSWSFLAHL